MDNKNRVDLFKRTKLSHSLPLRTPFRLGIDPSSACNFKCVFCYHSLLSGNKYNKFVPKIMDFELFNNIINQAMAFNDNIKVLSVSGLGEPLLNKDIDKMVSVAKKSKKFDKICVTTNGSLLTEDLSMKLIDAGLDELIISIEGMTAKKYKEIAAYDIDFEKFLSNISYFYKNRKQCKVFVKIIDIGLEGEQEYLKFKEIFDPICNMAYMEHTGPLFRHVDYNKLKIDFTSGTRNQPIQDIDVCPLPFYNLMITAGGEISSCCANANEELILGNIEKENLIDIWNGEKYNSFLITHLKKRYYSPIYKRSNQE